MQQRAYIVHGWDGSPQGNWFPWLKRQLEAQGFAVRVPAMPNSAAPLCDEWLEELREDILAPDEETYLIGHSLGCIALLKFLEALAPGERVGGVVLVAGFVRLIGYDELRSFFTEPLNDLRVRDAARRFIAFHADDDPYVPLRAGEDMRSRFGAQLRVIHGGGHLNAGSGFSEFPEVLDAVLELSGHADVAPLQ